ncbi:MAG: signal peptidase II [Thermoanaerobaculia bacterium]
MKKPPYPYFFLLTIFLILADRISKTLISAWQLSEPYVVIKNFFQIVKVYNVGIAFGFFSGVSSNIMNPVIVGIGFVAIGWILYLLFFEKHSALLTLSFHLLLAGAIGNIWDRFLYGAVLDFLDFSLGKYHWPSFNISDSCITIGLILLLWDTLIPIKKNVS